MAAACGRPHGSRADPITNATTRCRGLAETKTKPATRRVRHAGGKTIAETLRIGFAAENTNATRRCLGLVVGVTKAATQCHGLGGRKTFAKTKR